MTSFVTVVGHVHDKFDDVQRVSGGGSRWASLALALHVKHMHAPCGCGRNQASPGREHHVPNATHLTLDALHLKIFKAEFPVSIRENNLLYYICI